MIDLVIPPRSFSAPSFVAHKIELMFESVILGGGTCFFYSHEGIRYLVTNWHNIAGIDPLTGTILGGGIAIPDRLAVHFNVAFKEGESRIFKSVSVSLGLYHDEDRLMPMWMEHPVHGKLVDLVVIPFPTDDHLSNLLGPDALPLRDLACVNDARTHSTAIAPRAGMDAFVLGFPVGLDGGGLPIWKRASIATEPYLDLEGYPRFLIDTATRKGMSGSPVFASVTIDKLDTAGLASRRRFLGIYSGRFGTDEFLAQLGIVWKESAIIETIEAKKVGETRF